MCGRKLGTGGGVQREGVSDTADVGRGTPGPFFTPRSFRDVGFRTHSDVQVVHFEFQLPVSFASSSQCVELAQGVSETPAFH